jgi:hypothetical protein
MLVIPVMPQPAGRDRNGLPFLQILGQRGAKVLAVAAALESLLAGGPWAARLTPDIARSKAAPKLKAARTSAVSTGVFSSEVDTGSREIASDSGFRAQACGKSWNDVVFSSKADQKRGETI